MERNAGSRWIRPATAALGVLAVVALAVPPSEARVRVSIRSTPKHHVSPSVPKPHVPEAPKVRLNTPSGRPVSLSAPSAAPARRGFFGRTWDWLLGRKPAPAPAAATTANIMAPVPSGCQSAGPGSPTAQDQEKQRAPGAGTNMSMAVAVKQAFGTREAGAAQRNGARPAALASAAEKPVPKPSGYILHLTNGSRITVPHYEERGDQVMVAQRQGSYGIPRSQVARIETQAAEPEVAPTGPGGR